MQVDRTTKFTLDFLDCLDRRLKIEWGSSGSPIFIPDRINHFSIQLLRSDLAGLCRSTALHDAILDMETCQRDGKTIQSTGVGLAPDFDVFCKLGLLLGDRLVLWDTLLQGMFTVPDHLVDPTMLGALACDLLLLKPVVARGGVVLLPHPVSWLERARYYFARAAKEGDLGTDFLGFLNARSLLDEGIALHPYSVSADREHLRIAKSAVIGSHDLLQDEAMQYHERVADLIQDENFLFLRAVSVDKFHAFLGHREYRHQLRALVESGPPGLSELEKNERFVLLKKELRRTIAAQNRDVALRHASITGAALGGVAASIALIHDAVSAAAFLYLFTGAMGTMSRWVPFCEKLLGRPRSTTLYQVFEQLEQESEKELLQSSIDTLLNKGVTRPPEMETP